MNLILNLILNMNGDTSATLVDNCIEARTGFDGLLRSMGRMTPHGRNFPNGGYEEAVSRHQAAMQKMAGLQLYLDLRAEELEQAIERKDAGKAVPND